MRKSPENGRGLMNYGVALMGRGNVRQALSYFERAELLMPEYEILQINMAIAKASLDEPGAEAHFLRALDIHPGYARGRYFFARWLVDEGRGPQAVRQLELSLGTSDNDLDVRSLIARLLAARGDEERLGEVVRRTLAIAPKAAIAAKRSHGALWPTSYQIIGSVPVVARVEEPLLAGVLLAAIALASLATAFAPARSLRW